MMRSIKRTIQAVMRSLTPRLAVSIESARSRAHSHRAIASWGTADINRMLVDRFGLIVQEGPFQGMKLVPIVMKEQIGPFLLGVYESELDGAWERVFTRSYSKIIDIGSKFGYYAVGLARKYPEVPVLAFDTDWWARKATRRMVEANGVGNVSVRSFCDTGALAAELLDDAFIISDCEGYEDRLFTPELAPSLRRTTLLIEIHECFAPGVSDRIRRTFAASHDLAEWSNDSPRRRTTQSLDFLNERERHLAEYEVRDRQVWYLLTPKD